MSELNEVNAKASTYIISKKKSTLKLTFCINKSTSEFNSHGWLPTREMPI